MYIICIDKIDKYIKYFHFKKYIAEIVSSHVACT